MWFGINAVVIPKTDKIARLKENFEWFTFKLDEDDIKRIKTLDKGWRTIDTA